jgi:hypothetical protein
MLETMVTTLRPVHDLVGVGEERSVGEPEHEAGGADDEHQGIADLLPGFAIIPLWLFRHSFVPSFADVRKGAGRL